MAKIKLVIVLYLIHVITCNGSKEANQPRIAIIGAGIGGTSAAYFLSKTEGLGPIIDVYSKDPVGGRLATINVAGREYETGGSVLHPKNKYMKKFAKQLGLKPREGVDGKFGLYDGSQFTYRQGNWDAINMITLLYRYGLSVVKLDKLIGDMLSKFDRIYNIQNEGFVFSNVPELVSAMDPSFALMLETSLQDALEELGFSKLFIQELATAVMRVNYGQLTDAHQFVGSVSLAGAESGLWAVHGGNKQIPIHLLKSSGANFHSSEVESVQLTPTDRFALHLKGVDDVPIYDAVILATPLTQDTSTLFFEDFPTRFKFAGRYHQIITTMVQGELNYETFHFPDAKSALDEILTTSPDVFFNSLSKNYPVDTNGDSEDGPLVWKVFSNNPLTKEQLSSLFTTTNEIHEIHWKAYPNYDSNSQTHGNFTLYPGLYHINAIEWAASAMEMSVIGARNVAMLTASHLGIDIQDPSKRFHDEL